MRMAKRLTGWCIRIAFVLSILAPRLFGQASNAMPIWGGPVVTPFGNVAINAPVRVCLIASFGSPCSTAGVTLYSDYNLTTPISNPTATNAYGTYSFFAPTGFYLIQVSVTPTQTYAYYYTIGSGGGSGNCPNATADFAQFSDGTACQSWFIDYGVTTADTLTLNTVNNPTPGGSINVDADSNLGAGPTAGGGVGIYGGSVTIDATTNRGTIVGGAVQIYGAGEDEAILLDAIGRMYIVADNVQTCGEPLVGLNCADSGIMDWINWGELGSTQGQLFTDWGFENEQGFSQDYPIELNNAGSPYTFDYSAIFEPCDASAGNVVVTLDTINGFFSGNDGLHYVLVKEDSTGNTCTFNAAAGQSINGNPSVVLSSQYQTAEIRGNYNSSSGDGAFWSENTGGGGGGGDTITSPNGTLVVGGTSSDTTLDLEGADGEIMAGSTPALTSTPSLGEQNSLAGSLTINGSSGTSGEITINGATGAPLSCVLSVTSTVLNLCSSNATITPTGGGLTVSSIVDNGLSTGVVVNTLGLLGSIGTTGTGNAVLAASPTLTGTLTAANLTATGTITFADVEAPSGDFYCLQVDDTGVLSNTGATCGGGGGGSTTVQVNGGSGLTTANLVNNTGAGEIDITNPSGSTVNFTLHNTATTVNSQTCTLGSTCTIPFETNSSGNTSQAGINLETSSTNATGLTDTPTNTATNVEKFEITGTVLASAGGTGISTSSSTGVAQVSSGTWSVSTALANGTTATTQSAADNTTKVATDAFVIANSFSNPMTTLGDTVYGGVSGVVTRLAGPTAGAGTYVLSDITSGSSAVATSWTNLATYLASPPAIGGSSPSTGKFTSLTDTGVSQYGVLIAGGSGAVISGAAPGTSGLPLLSQGASSNPAFGALALSGLATQAANTLLGNGTASTATPTALAIPSCSAFSDALIWTSGTGPQCNTSINAATLGGKSLTGSGAGVTSGPTSSTSGDIATFLTAGQIQDSGVKYGTTGNNVLQLTSGLVPVANLPLATSSTAGAVEPDNSTITVSGGVMTAVSGNLGAVQLIMPTSTINGGTCTSAATVTITGLAKASGSVPGSTFSAAFETNPSAVTGWGSTGSLTLNTWVSAANTMSWNVCNATGNSITPGAINVDVGAH